MRATTWMFACIAMFGCEAACASTTTTVVDIPIAAGADTQRFLYLRPDAPVANIVAIPGANGVLGIQNGGAMTSITASCDPVPRNAQAFPAHGYSLALVDATFNGSVWQISNILEVVRYVRGHDNVPTWIIGGSAAMAAVVGLAASMPASIPGGAIFDLPGPFNSADAALVSRPALVMFHTEDPLAPSGQALFNGLTAAPAKELTMLSGGVSETMCPGPGGYHIYNGLDAEFVAAATDFIARHNDSFGPSAPNMNQHGLTGVWYEPATTGQGLALELYPDLVANGTGLVAGGWFTYDVAPAGGAEKQRWYSVNGAIPSGAASAAVNIFRNIGGNFDSTPATNAQNVGTGTLTFSTCDAAQLDYAFNDGRAGTLALSRITSNVECTTAAARPTSADFGLSGNWYNAATSGQGLIVEVNPISDILFFAWYTYAPTPSATGVEGQRWYTAQGAYGPGARSVSVTLSETTGGIFDTPTPAAQKTNPVGTATLTFESCVNASLTYTFTAGTNAGLSGAIALQRPGPAPASCMF